MIKRKSFFPKQKVGQTRHNKKQRIGIMGGTFDPIHIGHLILAQSAYEQLGLDKVLFIPSGKPPHKPNRFGASDSNRVEMTRLAIAGNPAFELNLMEMDSETPTYTYLTVKQLCMENPDTEYYFILGEDSLIDFLTWKKPEELVKYCHIVCGVRPGLTDEEMDAIIEEKRMVTGGDYIRIDSPLLEISSCELRGRIKKGLPVKYYVPSEVAEYIQTNDVYKE